MKRDRKYRKYRLKRVRKDCTKKKSDENSKNKKVLDESNTTTELLDTCKHGLRTLDLKSTKRDRKDCEKTEENSQNKTFLDESDGSKDTKKEFLDACKHGKLEVVQRLENDFSFVGCRDERNQSPLHYATMGGHVDVVKVLL